MHVVTCAIRLPADVCGPSSRWGHFCSHGCYRSSAGFRRTLHSIQQTGTVLCWLLGSCLDFFFFAETVYLQSPSLWLFLEAGCKFWLELKASDHQALIVSLSAKITSFLITAGSLNPIWFIFTHGHGLVVKEQENQGAASICKYLYGSH